MLRVGITGGIGSGKTTVCQIFEYLGVPVYYADRETKALYQTHPGLKSSMINAYGPDIYIGQTLNKDLLSRSVFGSEDSLSKLNSIVHPFVFEHYEQWCKIHENRAYTLKEAAIIFESGSYKHLHQVIGVLAPLAERIKRIHDRDGLAESEIRQRIDRQMKQEDLVKKCHYIIENDGKHSLLKQVISIHSELLKVTATNKQPKFLD
jgi:dephospho-CoA kinase